MFPRRLLSWRASACVWLVLASVVALDVWAPVPAPPHNAEFWGFLFSVAVWGWRLFEAAGRITLAVLHAMFLLFRTTTINALRLIRTGFWSVGKLLGQSLDVFKWLYRDVIRPALSWSLRKIQALERYLKTSFAPVFEKIRWLKDRVNLFYRHFVRPVLDVIDIIRQTNRVLKVFHIDLLGKLEQVLTDIERRIEQPFQWIYRRLTEVENWLNRIVTFDGLFQRIMLVRSIERDIRQVSRAFTNWRHADVDPRTYDQLAGMFGGRSVETIAHDTGEVAMTGGGYYGAVSQEIARQWSIQIRR